MNVSPSPLTVQIILKLMGHSDANPELAITAVGADH